VAFLQSNYCLTSGADSIVTVLRGDESYGRNWGYYCLLDAFRDIFERGDEQEKVFESVLTGFADGEFYQKKLLVGHSGGFFNGGRHQLERPNFFITPQGRCAETLLFSTLARVMAQDAKSDHAQKPIIISNGFFDTTGANAAVAGFELQTFTQPGLSDEFPQDQIGLKNNFKGNMDVVAAERFIDEYPGQVSMLLMTITNNWAAAQPVSMANLRAAASLAARKEIPLFYDACRFAENAFFIHEFEEGYSNVSIANIVKEMFSYAEGFTISLKKDGLSNMGGVLCLRDQGLFAQRYKDIGVLLKEMQILCYGNDSYGGSKFDSPIRDPDSEELCARSVDSIFLVSGRDLMASVVGLYEVTKESYLRGRVRQVQSFCQRLQASGIAVLSPPGGHAIYLDMDDFFYGCGRSPGAFAGLGFCLELIKDFGIRAAEAGPFGWEWDRKSPEEQKLIPNLVRFAVPRHVMSDEHINYTVAAIRQLYDRRHTIPNVRISRGKDMRVRHFSCGLEPIPVTSEISGTFLDESSRQLELLSRAIGQSPSARDELLRALNVGLGQLGQIRIPDQLSNIGWVSHVSNDHSPIEYSVALNHNTGKAELRFLIEAQPAENDLLQAQQCALSLMQTVASQYGSIVSLRRFESIRHLFMPAQPQGNFAAWYSCALSEKAPVWKVYLNPRASGNENALDITRQAFNRLGAYDQWRLIESNMDSNDSVVYFSLDLCADEQCARVKVYIAHDKAYASRVAAFHSSVCSSSNSYDIQRFCETVSGGSLGPYTKKPVLSCFAITTNEPKATGTVHFPVDSYVGSDAEAQTRVKQYMDVANVSSLYRQRYMKLISAVQRRPLAEKAGIHSWISLKQESNGHRSNGFYLSPELFG
jgi:tryptophanase